MTKLRFEAAGTWFAKKIIKILSTERPITNAMNVAETRKNNISTRLHYGALHKK